MKLFYQILILMLCANVAIAQDSTKVKSNNTQKKKKKKKKLGTIFIRKKTTGNRIDNLNAIRLERLDSKELKKNACCTLAESFESNASVEISNTNALSGAKQVEMLGLQGTYVQTLVELLPYVRGINYTYGFNNIPGPFVESIYINKGPGSVTNGFESMTGQIDVELIKPKLYKPLLHINGYYNSFSRSELNLNTGIRLSEEVSTLFSAHGSQQTRKMDYNKDGFMDVPVNNMLHLMNRWKYDGKNMETMLMAKYHSSNRKGGSMDYDFDKDFTSQNSSYGIKVKDERIDLMHKIGFGLTEDKTKSIGLQTSFNSHNRNSLYGRNFYNGFQQSVYSNLIYQTELFGEGNELRLGGSVIHDNIKEEFQNISQNRKETVTGIFAEYTYHDLENTTILLGARGDYNWRLKKAFFTPRLNVKYDFNHDFSARLSAGSGFRTPTVLAENTRFFASNRKLKILEPLLPEQSWNYGVNLSYKFDQGGKDSRLSLDVFRTDFQSQVVVDYDGSPQEVTMSMLNGKSYGWYIQAEYFYELFDNLDLRLAYKFNEVKVTQNGQLRERVFNPRHRALANLAYETPNRKWGVDFTTQWTGRQRIPDYSSNPESMQPQAGNYSPDYFRLLGQITYKPRKDFELYAGSENITNYRQKDLIIGANNPHGQFFDAGASWGPSTGRMFYSGFRYTLKKKVEPLLTRGKVITEVIKVDGICEMCKDRIEEVVNTLKGIKLANWDEYTKELTVRYHKEKTNSDEIQQTIAAIGHDTEKYKASDAVYDKLHGCCKYRDDENSDEHDDH